LFSHSVFFLTADQNILQAQSLINTGKYLVESCMPRLSRPEQVSLRSKRNLRASAAGRMEQGRKTRSDTGYLQYGTGAPPVKPDRAMMQLARILVWTRHGVQLPGNAAAKPCSGT
jgi:hypothetical protein